MAHDNAAVSASMLPSTPLPRENPFWNIISDEPQRAISDPIIMFRESFSSLWNTNINKAVRSGAVLTTKATFDTKVSLRAVFSAMKYMVPPKSPQHAAVNSSFRGSMETLNLLIMSSSRYAKVKR